MSGKSISAAEFDARFDAGEDVSDHIDWSTAHRANLEARRVNVDLPAWMVAGLDREAAAI